MDGALDGAALGDTSLNGIPRAGPHPQPPTDVWGATTSAPLPTNRWWVNLVLDGNAATGDNVVSPLPYVAKVLSDGLHVCLPSVVATSTYVTLPFDDTLALGATEISSASQTIEAYDTLSVTVLWEASGGSMRTPLVRGMPYASARYSGLTPRLTFAASPITSINGRSPPAASYSGTRFEVALGNGQTWVLYTQTSVSVRVNGGAITFGGTYDGYVRVAAATSSSDLALLDTYASRIPTGGYVTPAAHGDSASLTFSFTAEGSGELLSMALPHHLEEGHLYGVSRASLTYTTLKGEMGGVVGDTWTVREALPVVEWGAPRPIDASRVDELRTALAADRDKPMLTPDPYGAGKEMAAVGRLALIADELGESDTATALRSRLATKLEQWVSGQGADPLVYDPTYGGIISSNGRDDRAADFGGGWYNDHHFHYGYFLYAAAAVGKANPAWLAQWAPSINHLLRDIANPSADDPLYTQHRFKDWYVGHSWASGLFPSASGRNQESVSEAINAWYGIALYGIALGDARLRDLGRLLLATELRSGYHYWQIGPESTTYPPEFASNGLAAVVWSTKVDKTTWFGSNVEYAYGIQTMPVTPVTELWLRPSWLTFTQPVWGPSMDTASEQWRGIVLMMAAVLQPEDAWHNAHLLTLYDNGNTRTNLLYWIATRPPKGEAPRSLDDLLANEPFLPTVPTAAASGQTGGLSGVWIALLAVLALVVVVVVGRRVMTARSAIAPAAPAAEADYERL